MEPDFLQALSQAPRGRQVAEKIFRSADGVVTMWEKTEAAASTVR